MNRKQEQRHIYYDADLQIEAYNLRGIVRKFPNHIHEYYVIGFIEGGKRRLWCKGREYLLGRGDLLLFNPGDNHFCEPVDGEPLDYRAVNIGVPQMKKFVSEITGREFLPLFSGNAVVKSEIAPLVGELYDHVLNRQERDKKEEICSRLLKQILESYTVSVDEAPEGGRSHQIETLCRYMDEHYAENLTLDQLAAMTSFGKSYLMRIFTKQIGVSPYRYLLAVRIDRAKKLLEQGVLPVEAAGMTGFSDQSHFTNFFREFIGLTPKQYQRIFEDVGVPASDAEGRNHEK